MSSASRQQGFSLLEALISVAISSIGIAGVYAMVSSSLLRLDNVRQRQELQTVAAEIFAVMETSDSDQLDGFSQTLTDCANLEARIGGALSDRNKVLMLNWCQRLDAEQGAAGVQTTRAISVSDFARADGVNFKTVSIELTDEGGRTRVAFKRVLREAQ